MLPPKTKESRPDLVVVDDSPLDIRAMELALGGEFRLQAFSRSEDATAWLRRNGAAAALLDLHLDGGSGLETLRHWRGTFPDLEVILCSGESRVERAIECMRAGASDYVVKPFTPEDLRFIVRRVVEKHGLKCRAEALDPWLRPIELVGESKGISELRAKLGILRNQTHLNVLILGESGTGKEVVARQLHQQEGDSKRPFVVANMPAIPGPLMEAELFGVEKGAYTDAKITRAGKFETAHGGDIFLDEIGELAPDTQSKLLRTLQERTVERVGSQRSRRIHFRVISATNQPLARLVAQGLFREDLMYRLSDLVLWLPPLRERREDIPLLARHFVAKFAGPRPMVLGPRAVRRLMEFSWPGNVRQLESAIKRAIVFNRGGSIEDVEIQDPLQPIPTAAAERRVPESTGTLAARRAEHERRLVFDALTAHGGDKAAAAASLGISRATFYRRLQELRDRAN